MLSHRFWAKVDQAGPISQHRPDLGPCWIWKAGKTRWGYGRIRIDGKRRYAHRLPYEDIHGPIPSGLEPDHLCRVRCCVNPDHLEPVTPLENAQRGIRHTKTHCIRGHALSGTNLLLKRNGRQRNCRQCGRILAKTYREKKSRTATR